MLLTHEEKVKSFAPKICHYVADVFVGPTLHTKYMKAMNEYKAGVILDQGSFQPCPNELEKPSCALRWHSFFSVAYV